MITNLAPGRTVLTNAPSKVSIEREKGPLRWARLPAEPDPIAFGVHSEVARHYGVTPEASPPHATTLDYLVAAAAG